MRRIITAAAVATLAVAGTAGAASRWIITSTSQIKPSVRAALRGNQGPRGRTGPTGAPGARGPAGISGVVWVRDTGVTLAPSGQPGDVQSSFAACPVGTEVVGGGWSFDHDAPNISSVPTNGAVGSIGWGVLMVNNASYSSEFFAQAECVTVPAGGAARDDGADLAAAQARLKTLLAEARAQL